MARLASRSCTCALILAIAVAHLATQSAHAASLAKACGGKLTATCTTYSALVDATPATWTVEAGTADLVVVVRFAGLFTANVSLGATMLTPLEANRSAVYGIVPKTGGSLTLTAYSDGVPVVYSVTSYPRAYTGTVAAAHLPALKSLASTCCSGIDTPACKALAAPATFCSFGANGCSAKGEVVHLVLPGGLKCDKELPPDMLSLTTLQTIDFSRSSVVMSGQGFFQRLFSMESLMHLHMSGNELSGELNDEELALFGENLVPIATVDLSHNMLKGNLSNVLLNLPKMSYFNMAYNNISGEIPAVATLDVGEVSPYRVVDISNNRLQGNADFEIPLLYLDVHSNSLDAALPVTDPKTIVYYDAHNNTLGPSTFLTKATNLVYIDISANLILGGVENILPKPAASLAVLIASGIQLHGSIPAVLATLPSLRHADLNSNNMDGNLDTFAAAVPATSALTFLNISSNNFEGGLSSKLGNLGMFQTKEIPPMTTFSATATPKQAPYQRVFDVSKNPFLGGDYPLWMADAAAKLSESYRAQGIAPTDVLSFQTQGGKLGCPADSSSNKLDAQGVIAIQNLGFTCYDAVQDTDIGLQDSLYKMVPGLPAPPPPPIKYIGKAPPSKSDKKWKIMGIVLGVLFALALVMAGVFMYKWRDLDLKLKQRYHKQTGDEFKQNYVVSPKAGKEGDLEHGADQNNIQ